MLTVRAKDQSFELATEFYKNLPQVYKILGVSNYFELKSFSKSQIQSALLQCFGLAESANVPQCGESLAAAPEAAPQMRVAYIAKVA